MEEDMEKRPLTESAGSMSRGTEESLFTETALARARARRAAARMRRRLAQRRVVVDVVVGGDMQQGLWVVILILLQRLIPSDAG
jgi:hypothetical protein